MYSLSKYEKETVITFNDKDDMATIYTCNKSLINKLDKFCSKSPVILLKKSDEYSKTYIIPKKYISIRFPHKISEELREKRAKKAREIFHKNNQGGV